MKNLPLSFMTLCAFILASTFSANVLAATRTCSVNGGNWDNTATWGGSAVPVAGDDVIIPQNMTVIVNITNAVCRHITIGDPSTSGVDNSVLQFLDNTSQLTSSGTTTFQNDGWVDMLSGGLFISSTWSKTGSNTAFDYGIGKVRFTGNFTLPNFAGFDEFYDLEIAAGANTVTLSRAITVYRDLIFSSGTLDVNTNKAITVKRDWTNAGGTFTEGTGTVTFSGTGTQTITGGETFYNLTTNTTGPLTLATADVTVANTLNMTAGLYNLNGRTLILGSSGVASTLTRTASSTTNWMYGGTFKRFWLAGSISSTASGFYGLFPMGTSAASTYRPFQINTTTNTTANGYFTVNHVNTTGTCDLSPYYSDASTDIQRIRNEQFLTTVSGVTGGTYSITVTQTQVPDPAPSALTDIRLATYVGTTAGTCTASAVGTHAAATGTVDNPTAIRTDVSQAQLDANNDFRISTINAGATPLPMELLYFTAVPTLDKKVLCQWATASEINNDYFILQRTRDGINYDFIAKVDGAGNSSKTLYYSDLDADPYPGTSYYRLKQVDFNGDSSYSQLVSVNLTGIDIINIFPNPASTTIDYLVTSSANSEGSVSLVDPLGRIMIKNKLSIQEGLNEFSLDVSSFSSGVYLIQVKIDAGLHRDQKQFCVK